MFFVGVDLAWSENNPSGVAVLQGDEEGAELVRHETVMTDEEIIGTVQDTVGDDPAVATVDAPLLVPNEEGRRPAEEIVGKLFRPYDAGAHPTNRKRLSQWTGRVRGEDIAAAFEDAGFTHDPYLERGEESRKVIEVYPHPSMVVLFDLDRILRYKNKSGRDYETVWEEFRRYQDHLRELADDDPPVEIPEEITGREMEDVRGQELKDYEDVMDAVFCSYLSYYYWCSPDDCAVLGDMETGYIMTPVFDDMWPTIEEFRSQSQLDDF